MGSGHLLDYFAVDIYPRKHVKMEFIFLPSKRGSNMAANATLNSLRPKIPCGRVCLLPTDIFQNGFFKTDLFYVVQVFCDTLHGNMRENKNI